MRAIISKVLTGTMIAGAALAVSACGSKTDTNTTTENTMVTDMNATEGMDTMTDNMTAVDSSMNGGMMSNDMGTMGNDASMGNSMTTTTTNTTTTNAM